MCSRVTEVARFDRMQTRRCRETKKQGALSDPHRLRLCVRVKAFPGQLRQMALLPKLSAFAGGPKYQGRCRSGALYGCKSSKDGKERVSSASSERMRPCHHSAKYNPPIPHKDGPYFRDWSPTKCWKQSAADRNSSSGYTAISCYLRSAFVLSLFLRRGRETGTSFRLYRVKNEKDIQSLYELRIIPRKTKRLDGSDGIPHNKSKHASSYAPNKQDNPVLCPHHTCCF
eukprot:02833_4